MLVDDDTDTPSGPAEPLYDVPPTVSLSKPLSVLKYGTLSRPDPVSPVSVMVQASLFP